MTWVGGERGRALVATATAELRRGGGVLLMGVPGSGVSGVAELIASRIAGARFVDHGERLDDEEARDLLKRHPQVVVAALSGARLAPTLVDAWTSGRLLRLDVQPLTVEETVAYLEHLLAAPVALSLATEMHRVTGGRALFLRETLADGLATGAFTRDGGLYLLDAGSLGSGARMADLLRVWMDELPEPARDVVQSVAIAGQLSLTTWLDHEGDADAVEMAELAGLVEVGEDGVLRVTPPVLAWGAAASMGAVRRAALQRRFPVLVDPAAQVEAARGANAIGSFARALTLADSVRTGPHALEARLQEAHALRFSGRPGDALAVLARVIEDPDARSGPGPTAHTRALVMTAEVHQYAYDDVEGALAVLDRIEESDRDYRELQRLVQLGHAGRFDECLHELAAAVDDPDVPERWRTRMLSPLIVGAAFAGDVERRQADCRRALSLAQRNWVDEPFAITEALAATMLACHLEGVTPDRAPADAVSRAAPDPAMIEFGGAFGPLADGRVSVALERFRRAEVIFSRHDPAGYRAFSLALAAHCAMLAGEAGDALAMGDRARRIPPRASRLLQLEADRALLWVDYLRGGAQVVEDEGNALAERAARHGLVRAELRALHAMLRLGIELDADRVADVRSRVADDSVLLDAVVDHAYGVAHADPDRLLRASGIFAAHGDALVAAESSATAHRVAVERGLRGLAREAELRTRAHLRDLGPIHSPALSGWQSVTELTAREREVALLASEGFSNREIAERIGVGKRTVEGHLHRAYTKLGVSDREALLRAL